jgi:hypothetical protein
MYLAYIDESGRPNIGVEGNIFVLSCLITNEQNWQIIDNRVKQIKIKHFPVIPHDEVEIHAKDMLNRTGIFSRLSFKQIYEIFDDVFSFISEKETEICAISVIIQKNKLYTGKDAEEWAYRLLIERINNYLSKKNRQRISNGQTPEYGIMIIDSCGMKADAKLRKKITCMLKKGTYYSDLKYLIEDPLFTDSKWRNLPQLIDCIAYATKKKYKDTPNPTMHMQMETQVVVESKYFQNDSQGRG